MTQIKFIPQEDIHNVKIVVMEYRGRMMGQVRYFTKENELYFTFYSGSVFLSKDILVWHNNPQKDFKEIQKIKTIDKLLTYLSFYGKILY